MQEDKPAGQDPTESEKPTDIEATEKPASEATPAEKPAEEPQTPEVPPEVPKEEPKEEPQERRGDRRIGRLVDKLGQTSRQRDYYRQQLAQDQPYQPLEYQGGEFDPKELEQDRSQFGNVRYQQGMQQGLSQYQQEIFIDRLELDSDRVAQKYSVLDDNSEDFDPDLTDNLNRMYLDAVGYDQRTGLIRNPSVRYKDYVETSMAIAERFASSKNADTAKNIAKQSARGGVRPSAEARKTLGELQPGDISSMTTEEYERHKSEIDRQVKQKLGIE